MQMALAQTSSRGVDLEGRARAWHASHGGRTLGTNLLRARVLALVLGLSIAIQPVAAAPAYAACGDIIWSSNWTVQKTDSRLPERTFTGKVVYQLGYDVCDLSFPAKIKIVNFTEGMSFNLSDPNWPIYYHTDYERNVHTWFDGFLDYQYVTPWHNGMYYEHKGNGSWSRTSYPGTVLDYYPTVAISTVWVGCGGVNNTATCKWAYQFRKGVILMSFG